MIQEYPDYFLSFQCIGGACKDSCCIGWEVDIDEESYYYYQTLEGPFGDLIRSRISVSPEGDYYFPMAAHRRCPFLNKDNLCDMITELGEEALCITCDEYPRYFNRIGSYEQVDVSLSCMEVGRLVFSTKDPICFEKSELEEPQWDEEEYEEEEEPVDEKLLESLLRSRDAMTAALLDRTYPINLRITRTLLAGDGEETEDLKRESYEKLLARFKPLLALDRRWSRLLRELEEKLDELKEAELACFHANRTALELWFEKLSVYFTFRYHLDEYFDGEESFARRLTIRSLQMIWLLLVQRWLENGKEALTADDMIDVAHIYSRQVEHCEENVDFLKR